MIFEERRVLNLALAQDSPFVKLKRKKQDFKLPCPERQGFQSTKYNIHRSTLPYKVQTNYETLENKEVETTVVIMENDYLKAEFLPSYGGRLYRLYDKKKKQDLVYYNDKPELSNIALCNAWFAGGIEFNIGSIGHHRDTSREIPYEYGEDILHFENYARRERQFYSLDFKLDKDVLIVEVYISNLADTPQELYWWTNAATECKKIDCSSKKTLYRIGGSEYVGFKDFDLNEFPENLDPNKLNESIEYFMDCRGNDVMWESVELRPDCTFYEIGTQPLNFRKMFCWGVHQGGNQWNDFLVGKGNRYIEIQSGLAPTQMHTTTIDKTVTFKQVFTTNFDYGKEVLETKDFFYHSTIYLPFMALDHLLHGKSQARVIDAKTKYYYDIIDKKKVDIPSYENIEYSVDMALIPYLDIQDNYYSNIQKGVILFENDEYEKAIEAFKRSVEQTPTVLGYHMLAESDPNNAIKYYEKAIKLEGKEHIYVFYAEKLLEIREVEKLEKLFKVYIIKSDLDMVNYIKFLEMKGDIEELNKLLLGRKWVNIVEGDTILSDIYQRVNKTKDVPPQIDFRQFIED